MTTISDVVEGRAAPAIYRYVGASAAGTVAMELAAPGWRLAHLDGRLVDSRAGFLDAIGRALGFPSWYGRNWDALEDCLLDLSWLPADGRILLWEEPDRLAHADRTSFELALEVLRDAVEWWQARGVPFVVLLRGDDGAAGELPELS